jgi:hypothetical protein
MAFRHFRRDPELAFRHLLARSGEVVAGGKELVEQCFGLNRSPEAL